MTNPTSNLEILKTLSERLRADGGRYLLSVGLTRQERDAQPEPTYGGKGHVRWLTDEEYKALCAVLSSTQAYEAEEYECAMMHLDDLGIPRAQDGKTLSLVGRISKAGSVVETTRESKLETALRGLYWDQVDYLTLNKLGGMQNHWMRAAREALGMDIDDVRPSQEETAAQCGASHPGLPGHCELPRGHKTNHAFNLNSLNIVEWPLQRTPIPHSVEDDFQHWLSYSGNREASPSMQALFRAAYYAGRNVTPPEKVAAQSIEDPPRCFAEQRGSGLVCTLMKGHSGMHEARGLGDSLFDSWSAENGKGDGT